MEFVLPLTGVCQKKTCMCHDGVQPGGGGQRERLLITMEHNVHLNKDPGVCGNKQLPGKGVGGKAG